MNLQATYWFTGTASTITGNHALWSLLQSSQASTIM